MHYAAKNNAAASIKVMLRLGALINDRDYKRRTPLFVAAETGKIYFILSAYSFVFCIFTVIINY